MDEGEGESRVRLVGSDESSSGDWRGEEWSRRDRGRYWIAPACTVHARSCSHYGVLG